MMKSLSLLLLFLVICYHIEANTNTKQNFCQHNRCLTCVGRYCATTCQGESCQDCPLGDCCDGSNCNICRGEICCKTEDCNNCVNNCLKNCQGVASCHYDCFRQCIPNQDTGNGTQGNNYNVISNRNYLPVNVTTVINITNTIKNENFIHNPITVNTTNKNNYTASRGSYQRKEIIINSNPIVQAKYNCCDVVHPEICQNIRSQRALLCYRGKHQECSALCTSKHIHIVETKEENKDCIAITKHPYFFCGKYVTVDCDNCYNCTKSDVLECSSQEINCSDACKASITAEQFYNTWYRKDS